MKTHLHFGHSFKDSATNISKPFSVVINIFMLTLQIIKNYCKDLTLNFLSYFLLK